MNKKAQMKPDDILAMLMRLEYLRGRLEAFASVEVCSRGEQFQCFATGRAPLKAVIEELKKCYLQSARAFRSERVGHFGAISLVVDSATGHIVLKRSDGEAMSVSESEMEKLLTHYMSENF